MRYYDKLIGYLKVECHMRIYFWIKEARNLNGIESSNIFLSLASLDLQKRRE
jgi:hypothetical protein